MVEYEPLVTLSPFELIDHLKTVDRLEWAIENAPAHIDQLDTAITNLTSQRRELTQVRDQLLEERNTFAETSPLLFGVKKWEASLTQLDRVLDGHDQTLGRYGTQLDDLAGQRTNWTQYRSLTVQLEYGTAKTAVDTDRTNHGHNTVDDPEMVARLGPTPAAGTDAFDAWASAAGTIAQHKIFGEHRYDYEHQQQDGPDYRLSGIGRQLKADTRTATRELGQHVNIEQIPDLQPKTISRTIEGPSLGL